MEVWKPIPGCDGYEASNLGRVRSWRKSGRRGGTLAAPRILKPSNAGKGYLKITIMPDRVGKYLHIAVLEAHVGPPPEPGMQACHYPDSDRKNCAVSNLRWGTVLENAADRKLHGTDASGERNGQAKLSDDAVRLLRWLRSEHGVPFRELASWFDVTVMTAWRAATGNLWRHV